MSRRRNRQRNIRKKVMVYHLLVWKEEDGRKYLAQLCRTPSSIGTENETEVTCSLCQNIMKESK